MSNTPKIISNSVLSGKIEHLAYVDLRREAPEGCSPLERLEIHGGGRARVFAPYRLERDGGTEFRHYSIICVIEGDLRLEANGAEYELKPGYTAVIPSWFDRRLSLRSGEVYDHLFFIIKELRRLPQENERIIIRKTENTRHMENIMALHAQYAHDDSPRGAGIKRDCAEILRSLFREELDYLFSANGGGGDAKERFDAVWKDAGASPAKNWTVEELAGKAGVSVSQFFALCHRLRGKTPGNILLDIKIGKAKEILAASDYKLDVIAEYLGYSSAAAFSKVFLKHSGLRPGRFRKNNAG